MTFSFSKTDASGAVQSMWQPKLTGDYAEDCAQGREYADEVVAAMRAGESQALLGWVVRGFGQDDDRAAVEIGFCQRLAEHALS